MPADSGESRPRLPKSQTVGAPPPDHEQLPCPRCDSTNTKFCYYNNYNFSQPRHFCKSCRRYWTHGGTLRDIPVGGGTRKSAKRSRTATTASSVSASVAHASPITGVSAQGYPFSSSPMLPPAVQFGGGVSEVKGSGNGLCGSFTSLLNTQGPTLLALGGLGLGLGPGFEESNFGLGRGMWALGGLGDGAAGVAGNGGAVPGMGNAWQFEGGDGGFVNGDCFAWPDLAISTPGSGLK